MRRDPANREVSVGGKRDSGKPTKKTGFTFSVRIFWFRDYLLVLTQIIDMVCMSPDKAKSAKEEARELLLKEEASIRERVKGIQEILTLMLRALGEMAIANPVFAHSKLPSMVRIL